MYSIDREDLDLERDCFCVVIPTESCNQDEWRNPFHSIIMSKYYYLYIVASDSGTLYVGITNDLGRRIWEHKNEVVEGFTKKYGCKKLVYYEYGQDIKDVIVREKQLEGWNRKKKEDLIKTINPGWFDLSKEMLRFEN